MWYLRRFFFVSAFAIRLQLLRHLTPFYLGTNNLFGLKQQVVLLKTSGCFTQNDGSFYSKRRVVLLKQQVVLLKTTARFTQNDGSFYQKQRLVCCILYERHNPCNSRKRNCKKFYNSPSHAYACAHITGVLHFLLSQVSQASS